MKVSNEISGGGLWFGRHADDGDILVLDPERSPTGSMNVTFFSLTQLRSRTFPPAIVQKRIQEISDPEQRAKAEGQYRLAPTLAAERERKRENESVEAAERQKLSIIETHRLYLKDCGMPYKGVQDSSEPIPSTSTKRRQAASCHRCGIRLDDFVQTRCLGCTSVLCSCGGCACRAPEAAA